MNNILFSCYSSNDDSFEVVTVYTVFFVVFHDDVKVIRQKFFFVNKNNATFN